MPLHRSGQLCISLLVLFWVFSIAVPASGAEDAPSRDSVVRALRRVPLFAALDDTQLRRVAEVAELRSGKKEERIITQGKRIGRLSVVLDSEAQVRIDGELIVVLPPNALVGEIEFLIDVPATADVVLSRDSRVLVLENQSLRKLMNAHPGIGYLLMDAFAKMEARRLRRTTLSIEK
jgi:CRP-like cAMP-binding protein